MTSEPALVVGNGRRTFFYKVGDLGLYYLHVKADTLNEANRLVNSGDLLDVIPEDIAMRLVGEKVAYEGEVV